MAKLENTSVINIHWVILLQKETRSQQYSPIASDNSLTKQKQYELVAVCISRAATAESSSTFKLFIKSRAGPTSLRHPDQFGRQATSWSARSLCLLPPITALALHRGTIHHQVATYADDREKNGCWIWVGVLLRKAYGWGMNEVRFESRGVEDGII